MIEPSLKPNQSPARSPAQKLGQKVGQKAAPPKGAPKSPQLDPEKQSMQQPKKQDERKLYREWGLFLKDRREARYRSAREFCARVDLGISYPQNSRYETGAQLPSLQQAVRIAGELGVPMLECVLEWSRAQVRDARTRAELESLVASRREERAVKSPVGSSSPNPSKGGAAGSGNFSGTLSEDEDLPSFQDSVVVFSQPHLRLFSSDPIYRDLFTYLHIFCADQMRTASQIAIDLGLRTEVAVQMLEKLADLGVIVAMSEEVQNAAGFTEARQYGPTSRAYYFPDDANFFALRNMNLQYNIKSILEKVRFEDISRRRAYRGLLTRGFSPQQVKWIHEKLEALLDEVLKLPPQPTEPTLAYSLCLLFGERFPGDSGRAP